MANEQLDEMILLGAGASIGAHVPASFKMTERIVELFEVQGNESHLHVIRFVLSGLIFQKGIRNENPLGGVDVEELFSAVQILANRSLLEASPFIGSWHDLVDRLDRVRPSQRSLDDLSRAIYETVAEGVGRALTTRPGGFDSSKIDRSLMEAITKLVHDASRGRSSTHLSGSSSIGRAVEDYLRKQTETWNTQLRGSRPDSRKLKREFAAAVSSMNDLPGEGAVYADIAEEMILMLKQIVWVQGAEKVAYLAPILGQLEHQECLPVATLNYDNAIELLAQSKGVNCDTGIESWSDTGQFSFGCPGISLMKLHGSIDWATRRVEDTQDSLPHSRIEKIDMEATQNEYFHPAVIFGQKNKLTAEGPFIDLLQAFRNFANRARRITVVGYSFRDAHINEYLSRWLNGSTDRILRVIDPSFATSRVPFAVELRRHLGQSRLVLVEETAERGLISAF